MDFNQLIAQFIAQQVQAHLPDIIKHVSSAIGGGHHQAQQPQGLISNPNQFAAPAQNFAPDNSAQQTQGAPIGQTPNANMTTQFANAPTQQFQQPGGTPATAEMIQTLITPMVQNEAMKAALTQQMQAMGIASLNDVRPDQLNDLYQRFLGVQQQFAQGQQNAQVQPQANLVAGGGAPAGGII